MIDYKLVGKILDELLHKDHAKFSDEDEKMCYLLQETWHLAQKVEREDCAKAAETFGVHPSLNVWSGGPEWYRHGKDIAKYIRTRGQA